MSVYQLKLKFKKFIDNLDLRKENNFNFSIEKSFIELIKEKYKNELNIFNEFYV